MKEWLYSRAPALSTYFGSRRGARAGSCSGRRWPRRLGGGGSSPAWLLPALAQAAGRVKGSAAIPAPFPFLPHSLSCRRQRHRAPRGSPGAAPLRVPGLRAPLCAPCPGGGAVPGAAPHASPRPLHVALRAPRGPGPAPPAPPPPSRPHRLSAGGSGPGSPPPGPCATSRPGRAAEPPACRRRSCPRRSRHRPPLTLPTPHPPGGGGPGSGRHPHRRAGRLWGRECKQMGFYSYLTRVPCASPSPLGTKPPRRLLLLLLQLLPPPPPRYSPTAATPNRPPARHSRPYAARGLRYACGPAGRFTQCAAISSPSPRRRLAPPVPAPAPATKMA